MGMRQTESVAFRGFWEFLSWGSWYPQGTLEFRMKGVSGPQRTCALVHAMLSLADLQLQPAGWLCPSSIDKGSPQALLTVRGVARWAPVDEVP